MTALIGDERAPRVVIVVEGGSRQLIGVYDKDINVPAHTGEITLYNPLQFIGVPPNQNADGFVMGPILPTIPVDEMVVEVTSIIEVEQDSKLYRKYLTTAEEILKVQAAVASGLTLAREMPKGGPIVAGR